MAKLSSEKQKNSLFPKKKSLVGSTPEGGFHRTKIFLPCWKKVNEPKVSKMARLKKLEES